MWDLILNLPDAASLVYLNLLQIVTSVFNLVDPTLYNGFLLFNSKLFYQFPLNASFFFGIKFCLSIAFLILIRGGTPRYRYDYLTKLGWLKFLGFIVLMFVSSTILFFIF